MRAKADGWQYSSSQNSEVPYNPDMKQPAVGPDPEIPGCQVKTIQYFDEWSCENDITTQLTDRDQENIQDFV